MDQRLTEPQRALAASYLPWLGKLMRPYMQRYPNLRDELQHAGLLGLMIASRRWDESRGVRFSTYSAFCIKHQIAAFLRRRKKSSPTHSLTWDVPSREKAPDAHLEEMEEVSQILRRLNPKYQMVLEELYLKGSTPLSISKKLGVTRQRCQQIKKAAIEQIRSCYGQ